MAKILTFNRKKPSPQLGPPKESVQRKITGRGKSLHFVLYVKLYKKFFYDELLFRAKICTGTRSSTRVPCWHMGSCDTMEYANGSFYFCSLVDCSFWSMLKTKSNNSPLFLSRVR